MFTEDDKRNWVRQCELVGAEATEAQQERLVEWAVNHVPQDWWSWAADEAVFAGVPNVYTDLRMRTAENGAH